MMPYGLLTSEMAACLQPFVEGKRVWDLGAGDGTYTHRLVEMGAEAITAVDKESFAWEGCPKVEQVKGTFEAFYQMSPRTPDVAFVSWPQNSITRGLGELLAQVPHIVYLGLNCEERGTACGGPGLWAEVVMRPLLHEITHRRNDFLIWGPGTGWGPGIEERTLTREEQEAFDIWF